MEYNLGLLSDPNQLHQTLNIQGMDIELLKLQLKKMILIRKAEEKIADNIETGLIKCPCHLGIGQEAIGTAIGTLIRKTDRSFGAHRSHSHYLALNDNVYSLFAETLGKYDGCSRGMGGSMHIIDNENGFKGSVPIVGATIPIATGAGLAAKMDKTGDIAISYFGDGACEEGVFHESLNMAASMKLPVLYVCENNLFSSHLHISLRQPANSTARFAEAHRIKYAVVDGNDIAEMTKVLSEAIAHIRETNEPFFLEAVTYRWRGHVGPSEDTDVGVQRTEDLDLWKKRDPIRRLIEALVLNGAMSEEEYQILWDKIQEDVDEAWEKAEQADYPPLSSLLNCVTAKS